MSLFSLLRSAYVTELDSQNAGDHAARFWASLARIFHSYSDGNHLTGQEDARATAAKSVAPGIVQQRKSLPGPCTNRSLAVHSESELVFYHLRSAFVHRSNSFRHHFHDVSCELGFALNEGVESALINGQESAHCAGDYGCTSWPVVNEGHLADDGSWASRLDYLVTNTDIRSAFHQDKHHVARIPGAKNRLSSLNHFRTDVMLEYLQKVHVHARLTCSRWILSGRHVNC